MDTKTFIENMDMVHFLCQREVEQLQSNLSGYMLDSARMRHIIPWYNNNNGENGKVTACALMAYDNYMSDMEIIIDMARKFSIHLQLKKFNKADYCQSPLLKEYMQWNAYRDKVKKYDHNFEGFKQFVVQKTNCLSIEKNKDIHKPSAAREIPEFDRERSLDQANVSKPLGQNSSFHLVYKQLTKFEEATEETHSNHRNPFLTFSDEEDDLQKSYQVSELASKTTASNKSIPLNTPAARSPGSDLVWQDNAKYSKIEVPSFSIEESILQPNSSADSCVLVRVTYVADIEHFFAQIEYAQHEPIEPLMWTDTKIPQTQRLVRPPQLHDMVLAKYNKDECWYRAKVVEIDESNSLFKVFYVDYGNSEIMNLGSMAYYLPGYTREPFRAVPCRLADICAINNNSEERQQQAVDLVSLVILNQRFAVNILKRSQEGLLVRIIDEEYAEMTKNLVKMGYAKENNHQNEELKG